MENYREEYHRREEFQRPVEQGREHMGQEYNNPSHEGQHHHGGNESNRERRDERMHDRRNDDFDHDRRDHDSGRNVTIGGDSRYNPESPGYKGRQTDRPFGSANDGGSPRVRLGGDSQYSRGNEGRRDDYNPNDNNRSGFGNNPMDRHNDDGYGNDERRHERMTHERGPGYEHMHYDAGEPGAHAGENRRERRDDMKAEQEAQKGGHNKPGLGQGLKNLF